VVMSILVLFLCINVGVLYYVVLFGDFAEFERRVDLLEQRVSSLIKRDEPVLPEVRSVPDEVIQLTDQQKEELAQMAATSMEGEIGKVVKQQVADELAASPTPAGGVKEVFVPFGQASVTTSDYGWRDTGLQAEVNLGAYGEVKTVVFEATMRLPSGNGQVEARLYNATDGWPVAGSELTVSGMEAVYKRGGNLVLPAANKIYKVQMRTSLNYEGVMEMGRMKIVVK